MNEIMQNLPPELKKKLMGKLASMPEERREGFKKKLAGMSPDEIAKMLENMEQASPEEKKARLEKLKNMTPEELAKMSKQEEVKRLMQQKMQESGTSSGTARGGGRGQKAKAKDFSGTLKRLVTYKKGMMSKMLMVCVIAIIATICSVAAPAVLAKVLNIIQNKVATGKELEWFRIARALRVLGALYLLNTTLTIIQGRMVTNVAQDMVGQMRRDVNRKIMKLPFSYFDSNSKGDILSKTRNSTMYWNSRKNRT